MQYIAALISMLIPAAGRAVVLGALLLLVRICLDRDAPLGQMGAELALGAYLFTLNGITAFSDCLLAAPSYTGPHLLNLIPMVTEPMILMLLNFLLFLPLGLLLPLVARKTAWSWRKMLALGLAVSFVIEFVQYFGGRAADVDDLMMNAAGTVFGYLLYLLAAALRRRKVSHELVTRFAGAWAGAAAFFAGATLVCMH